MHSKASPNMFLYFMIQINPLSIWRSSFRRFWKFKQLLLVKISASALNLSKKADPNCNSFPLLVDCVDGNHRAFKLQEISLCMILLAPQKNTKNCLLNSYKPPQCIVLQVTVCCYIIYIGRKWDTGILRRDPSVEKLTKKGS